MTLLQQLTETIRSIREYHLCTTEHPKITEEATLEELGIDYHYLLLLILEVEDRYKILIYTTELDSVKTVSDLMWLIKAKGAKELVIEVVAKYLGLNPSSLSPDTQFICVDSEFHKVVSSGIEVDSLDCINILDNLETNAGIKIPRPSKCDDFYFITIYTLAQAVAAELRAQIGQNKQKAVA